MSEIWLSAVRNFGAAKLVEKQGIVTKYHGYDWEPLTHVGGVPAKDVMAAMTKASNGETLRREELPEAACVFSDYHLKRTHDFIWFGGFIGVTGKLAEILKKADFGDRGGLVPIPVYESDKKTVLPDDYFLINWGQHNTDSFLPKQSQNIAPFLTMEFDGREVWKNRSQNDDDIAVNTSALDGPDLWYEPRLESPIFMKEWVAKEIIDAKIKPDLSLRRCLVLNGND